MASAKAPNPTTTLVVAPGACNTLADAFERLRLDAIGVEALASAASTAIDEYRLPPSADRREFHRVHVLVSDTAQKSAALVELAEHLKTAFLPRGEDSQPRSWPCPCRRTIVIARCARRSSPRLVGPPRRGAGRAHAR
jgi:hypothetical protein